LSTHTVPDDDVYVRAFLLCVKADACEERSNAHNLAGVSSDLAVAPERFGRPFTISFDAYFALDRHDVALVHQVELMFVDPDGVVLGRGPLDWPDAAVHSFGCALSGATFELPALKAGRYVAWLLIDGQRRTFAPLDVFTEDGSPMLDVHAVDVRPVGDPRGN
jgi:hypothetical protein